MKKIIIYIFIVFLILACIATSVQATETSVQEVGFEFKATADKSTVEPEGEVRVTFSVSKINLNGNGMNTIEGFLEYDHDIFEEVTKSDVQSLNKWSLTYNDEDTDLNGRFFGMILGDGITEDQDIATITFKVKPNIADKTTKIKVKDIATNDGTNLVEESDEIVDIEIKKSVVNPTPDPTPDPTPNPTPNPTPDPTPAPTPNPTPQPKPSTPIASTNTVKKDNTNKLPQTGTIENYIILTIIIVAIIGIVFYRKYRNYRDY